MIPQNALPTLRRRVCGVVGVSLVATGLALPAALAGATSAATLPSISLHPMTVTPWGSTMAPFVTAVVESPTGTLPGMTVRIGEGFVTTDVLASTVSVSGVTASYDSLRGILRLRGTASAADYQSLIRGVTYTNGSGTAGTRDFVVTAGNATYMPENGNVYEYVHVTGGIGWNAAHAAANAATFNGVSGHLATITSEEENQAVYAETTANAWLGATDEAVDGEWRWVVGPEAGQQFWQGGTNGVPTNGMFTKWSPLPEPNGGPGENHMFIYSSTDYRRSTWNDAPEWWPTEGYVIEYEDVPLEEYAAVIETIVYDPAGPVPTTIGPTTTTTTTAAPTTTTTAPSTTTEAPATTAAPSTTPTTSTPTTATPTTATPTTAGDDVRSDSASAAPASLAFTGTQSAWSLWLSAALIASGAVVLVVNHRRTAA